MISLLTNGTVVKKIKIQSDERKVNVDEKIFGSIACRGYGS